MSPEEALSRAIDNLNHFIKSNTERTQILEGERTCTRFLIERMHEDLVRLKIKSHDDDFATQLRMLHNKIDMLTNKTNDIKADYQQQFDKLEAMLIKIIITLKHT